MSKRKIFITLLNLSLLAVSATPALAQTASVTPGLRQEYRQDKKAEIKTIKSNNTQLRQTVKGIGRTLNTEVKELRDEVKTGVLTKDQLKAQRTALVTAARIKQAQAIFDNLLKNFASRLDFLTQSKARIQAKINDKSKAGKDVSAATAKLAQYDQYSAAYTTDLAALNTQFTTAIGSSKPQTAVAQIRPAANKVRSDLQSMQQVLADTLRIVVKIK